MKKYLVLLMTFCSLCNPLSGLTHEEFSSWWGKYKSQPNVPKELVTMVDYYINSDFYSFSSQYWNFLNKKNIEQLSNQGYENFKQTIAQNYFTWVVNLDHPYLTKLLNIGLDPNQIIEARELARQHSFFNAEQSRQFNIVTALYIGFILQVGGESELSKLEEPLIGNPPYIIFKGKRVSQDILNSLSEYLSIARNMDMSRVSSILEIGAGSGRTAFCFLTLHPKAKYIIVDIPPALYLSQRYLTDVFPERKIFKFRPFHAFAEVSKELNSSDIVFLTPDQLSLLPDGMIDLFLAIDCMHEMKPEQIQFYFNQANRLSSHFYYKNWQQTTVPYDGYVYTPDSYPIPSTWKLSFQQPCFVPSNFYHALYSNPR